MTKEQELLTKGAELVKSANDTITQLRNEVASMKGAVDDGLKKTAALASLGEAIVGQDGIKQAGIVDKLIRQGFIKAADRAAALEGIKDPVKVAMQLNTVLDCMTMPSIGKSDVAALASSTDANPVDDRFRKMVGIG